MAISSKNFMQAVCRINSASAPLQGETISGKVSIKGSIIVNHNWQGCTFDSDLEIEGCTFHGDLDISGVLVKGRLTLKGVTFKKGGLIANGLRCDGSIRVSGVTDSHAQISRVRIRHEDKENIYDRTYTGTDLYGISSGGDIVVEDFTSKWLKATGREDDLKAAGLMLDGLTAAGAANVGKGFRGITALFAADIKVRWGRIWLPDEAECISLLTNACAHGDLEIVLCGRAKKVFLAGAKVGRDFKIVGKGPIAVKKELGKKAEITGEILDASDVTAQGNILIKDLAFDNVVLNGSRASGNFMTKNLAPASKAPDSQLRLIGVSAGRDLSVESISGFESVDLYQTSAINIVLHNVQVPHGAVILGGARASALLSIEKLLAQHVTMRYSHFHAALFKECKLLGADKGCSFDAQGISTNGYISFEAVSATATLALQQARIGGNLDFVECRADRLILDGITALNISLKGLELQRPIDSKSAAVSAIGARVTGAIHVSGGKFRGGVEEAGGILINFARAEICELDVGEDLPFPIRYGGATIGTWSGYGAEGKDPASTAERFHGFLELDPDFDKSQYMRVERQLDNEGKKAAADHLHVLGRRRERKESKITLSVFSWLHDYLLGYGTQKWRLVLLMTGVALASTVWVAASLPWAFRISPATLATLTECGASCKAMARPRLGGTYVDDLADGLAYTLRHSIPIVELNVASHIEPRPGTGAVFWTALLRIFGWISWPILLTSLVASLFPRRPAGT